MDKILICDDDHSFGTSLGAAVRSILDTAGRSAQIHIYERAEDIPKQILCDCDIAFLDIDFAQNGYTGIDIARQLRSLQNHAVIIFVTNFIEYAPEGYEVQAFRYLLKSDIDSKLERCIHQILEKMQSVQETVLFNANGETLDLPLADILYIESQAHTAVIFLQAPGSNKTKEYRLYSSLTSLEQQLEDKGFLRIQKSYLVNMRRIAKYQCNEAILDNGTVLKVSQKSYSEQKKKYLLWKGGK